MSLHHNKSFSQILSESLEIYQYKLCSASSYTYSKDSKRHACFILNNKQERIIDLTEVHLKNPLGFNHPIDLKKAEENKFKDYTIVDYQDQGSTFNFEDTLLAKKKWRSFKEGNIQNFHGHRFNLTKNTKTSSHKESNKIAKLLNYYELLEVFSADGVFQKLADFLKKLPGTQNGISSRFENFGEIQDQVFKEKGLLTNFKETKSLFLPLIYDEKIYNEVENKIKEALCSL